MKRDKPSTLMVRFPDGKARPVEAHFETITMEQLASVRFQHVPRLTPIQRDDFEFVETTTGWFAVPR